MPKLKQYYIIRHNHEEENTYMKIKDNADKVLHQLSLWFVVSRGEEKVHLEIRVQEKTYLLSYQDTKGMRKMRNKRIL